MSRPREVRETSVDWPVLARQARRDAGYRFGELVDLDDLVQDALILLLGRRERIDNPRAWVAATLWRLHASRRRVMRRGPAPAPDHRPTAHVVDPHLRLDLAAAARHLTSQERRLLVLLAQEATHREIAERLGVGWKSVGARIQRLRRKLRHLIGAEPERT